jgi:hypothetical protein
MANNTPKLIVTKTTLIIVFILALIVIILNIISFI